MFASKYIFFRLPAVIWPESVTTHAGDVSRGSVEAWRSVSLVSLTGNAFCRKFVIVYIMTVQGQGRGQGRGMGRAGAGYGWGRRTCCHASSTRHKEHDCHPRRGGHASHKLHHRQEKLRII